MKIELVNMHTHTRFCGHGEGEVAEVISQAAKHGITTLALTEHFPLPEQLDPDAYLSMPSTLLDDYCNTVEEVREEYPDMEVLLGCELDWLGEHEARSEKELDMSRFEIILGSVHFIDAWAFDDPNQTWRWEEEGADSIWTAYFQNWIEAVLSDKPFTVMSHPDLCKKFGFWPSFDPQRMYEQAAEAAKVSGRMVEVNTSGLYYACKEMYPAPALLREFCRAEVPCTIGSDAHKPQFVTRGLEQAYRLMYECGYREVSVPTRNGDRRSIPLA